MQLLLQAGVPAAPIYTIDQVVDDPHIAQDREMFFTQRHPKAGTITLTGSPLKLSDTPVTLDQPAPTLGQHTEEILHHLLGFNAEEIMKLKQQNVI